MTNTENIAVVVDALIEGRVALATEILAETTPDAPAAIAAILKSWADAEIARKARIAANEREIRINYNVDALISEGWDYDAAVEQAERWG